MGHTATQLEQLLARIAISLVLLDRIGHRLLGKAVLQLEGEDRQAVDEQGDVERALRFVAAVAKLPDDGEAVLLEAFLRLRVARRRRAVEKIQVVRAMLDAVAQHVDRAALGDFALQPGQELAPRRTVVVQQQRFGGVWLSELQESGKLDPIDAKLAVVVVGIAATPADAVIAGARLGHLASLRGIARISGESRADEAFEAAFGSIGGPHRASLKTAASLSEPDTSCVAFPRPSV